MVRKNEQKKNEERKLNKKNLTAIFAVVLFLVILILSLITLASTVKSKDNLAFLKYRYYIMDTNSHPSIAQRGDFVIAKKLKYGEVKVGDSIVYGGKKVYYCDEVIETKKNNTVTKMIIAESDGVKYQFSESDISGKVVKVIPKLGYIITFLRTPLGFVFFIIFTICIFLLIRFVYVRGLKKKEEQQIEEPENEEEIKKQIEEINNEK